MSSTTLWVTLLQVAADITDAAAHWLWQSTLVIAVGLAASRLLRSRGPALQSAIYRMTLVAALVCPLIGWFASHLGLTVAIPIVPTTRLSVVDVVTADITPIASRPSVDHQVSDGSPAVPTEITLDHSSDHIASGMSNARAQPPLVGATLGAENEVVPIESTSNLPQASIGPIAWRIRPLAAVAAGVISMGWILGSSFLLVRLLVEIRRVAQLRRGAVTANAVDQQLCRELAARVGVRPPQVLTTPFVSSPCLAGFWQPVILLPEELPSPPLSSILLHELAHLRRGDCIWNLSRQISLAAIFFQPLVWWLSRRLETTAEEICDDHVLRLGDDRQAYANILVTLAEQTMFSSASAVVPLVTLRSALAHRVRRILDQSRALSLRVSIGTVCLIVGFGVIGTPLAGILRSVAVASSAEDSKAAPHGGDTKTKQAADSSAEESALEPEESLVQVSGKVVDASDSAVLGATVRALYYNHDDKQVTGAGGVFAYRIPKTRVAGLVLVASDAKGEHMGITTLPWEAKPAQYDGALVKLGATKELVVAVKGRDGKAASGARVGILAGYVEIAANETDDVGNAKLRVPAAADCSVVYANKQGEGVDYRSLRAAKPPAKAPGWPTDGLANLSLGPTRKIDIRVTNPEGGPIAGLPIRIWYLQKPNESASLDSAAVRGLFVVNTNAEGVASFTDVPLWQERMLQFWPNDERFERQRFIWDPTKNKDGVVVASLDRVVPISGRVVLPDGSAAAGVKIIVDGAGYGADSFHGDVTTRQDGTFKVDVWPNELYLLVVDDAKWGAPAIDDLVVRPNTPISGLEFTLRPATRIHGRVVLGPNKKPVANQQVSLNQQGKGLHQLKNIEIPNPENSHRAVLPQVYHWTKTDADGRYEFLAGPGTYWLAGVSQVNPKKFTVTEEKDLTFDLEAPRPEKGPFSVQVLNAKTGNPIAGAKLSGRYRSQYAHRWLELTTDDAGRFQGERELHRLVLFASSPDGSLAGIVEIGPDESEATVKVAPVGSVAGQVIDEKTGQPLANREMSYGVRVHDGDDDAPFSINWGGKVTTSENGEFELTKLVVGTKYDIDVPINDHSWRLLGPIETDSPALKQLGKLILKKPYEPPTLAERIAQVVGGDPQRKYSNALKDAQSYRQRVAVLMVDPKSDSTRALFDLRFNDNNVGRALDNYGLVVVDATTDTGKALASKLDVVAATEGLPRFSLRDMQGVALVDTEFDEISVGGKIDKTRLVDLLRAHALEPLDARKLLDEALVDARKSNRRVLVQQTAMWCGPCHRLARYLEEHRAIWEKDYIWVRIDERWTNNKEVMDAITKRDKGGIPWMAILDADAKLLATSDGPKGNIGFPSEPQGIDHFMKMLKGTSQRLGDEDLNTLRVALEKQ